MRLSVAPLRYGAGIKGKIGTSLSHGLPCVGTPLAVEGMALKADRDVLVATTPGEFASAVVRAYTDPALWARLSEHGMAFVREHYSLDRGVALFGELLDSLGLNRRASGPGSRPQRDGLELAVLSSGAADRAYRRDARVRWLEREAIEAALIPPDETPFVVDGFCIACRRPQSFAVGFEYAAADALRPSRPELARAPRMRVRPECANASRHSRAHHDPPARQGRANLRDGAGLAPLCVAP